jgi:hypothetical protein
MNRYVPGECSYGGDGVTGWPAVFDRDRGGELFCLIDPATCVSEDAANGRALDIAGMFNEAPAVAAEVERLKALLNTPEVEDFVKGAALEAGHQRQRWPSDHDVGKTPFDWFWLVGYLAQKAAAAAVSGDVEKAKHHTISTAAVLANWHLALTGADTSMRPGIKAPAGAES